MLPRLDIDPDIRRARTLPPAVYHDPRWYRRMRERLFARTWHMHPGPLPLLEPGSVRPWNLLAGCLDEPLVLTRDEAGTHLVSNVCTHRGAVLVERPAAVDSLRCSNHGRRFSLEGRCVSMPDLEATEDFPQPCDHLAAVPWARWERFTFASLRPAHPLDELVAPLRPRLGYLPWDRLEVSPAQCRDYHVSANWALWCDRLLEGFAAPSAHGERELHLLPWGVLGLAVGSPDGACPSPPSGHPDHGRSIVGYGCWLFPCTVIRIHPWGPSIDVVLPLGPERTRIVHMGYVWDPDRLEPEAAATLDQREHEDERIIESIARGMRSALHSRGRYSPTRDQGVHHFHRLLARVLDEDT